MHQLCFSYVQRQPIIKSNIQILHLKYSTAWSVLYFKAVLLYDYRVLLMFDFHSGFKCTNLSRVLLIRWQVANFFGDIV